MNLRRTFTLLCAAVLLLGGSMRAQAVPVHQDTLNRVDELGRKVGHWRSMAPVAGKPGYPDGSIVEEGRYANGKRVGPWKRYWPNGRVMSEVTYRMGRPQGPYATYYPTGKLEEQGTWDLDRNTGRFQRWHPNGRIAQDFVFNAYGLRDGEQKYFHENGQLAVQVTIVDGKEDGTLERYTPDGQLQQVARFNQGVIDAANSRYISPAPRAAEVKVDANAPQAPVVTTGETTNAIVFRENGFNTLYDRQLRISQQGEFLSGRLLDGRRYLYDESGMLTHIQVYKAGRYVGDAPITEEDRQ
jgi:antitoxin component YwqK of YwqJK toxin-antitoxin module